MMSFNQNLRFPYNVVLVGVASASLVMSIFTFDIYLIALCAICSVVSIAVYAGWYLIEPVILRRTNLIELFDGFELCGDRSVAIRKLDSSFVATASAQINIERECSIERAKLENIIAHTSAPFKYTLHVQNVELNKLIDKLQTGKTMKQIQLSRLDQTPKGRNALRAGRLKQEIDQLERDIANVSTGVAPLKLTCYISTSAVSDRRFEAEQMARFQISKLASEFDALLGSKSTVLNGNQLLAIMRIDALGAI